MSEYSRKYYKEHKEKWKKYNNTKEQLEYRKKYNEINKEKIKESRKNNISSSREYKREYRKKNKEKLNAQSRKFYDKNKEKIKEYNKIWRNENREKIKEYKKKYRSSKKGQMAEQAYDKSHKKENREYDKLWKREFRKTEKYRLLEEKRNNRPDRKLHNNISRSLRSGLRRKTMKTTKYIGCSIAFIMSYLEKQFYANPETGEMMTWENQGAWHVDHIIPKSLFNIDNPEAILKCWNYKNLRPLWGKENMIKHAKIESVAFVYKYLLLF